MDACTFGTCNLVQALAYALQPLTTWGTQATAAVNERAAWLFPLAAGIAGASAASLIGLVVHRLPLIHGWNGKRQAGLGLAAPASHCDACGTPLSPLALVPVAGWIIAEGKCKECGARVPWVYPAAEAAVGFLSMIIVVLCGPGLLSLLVLVLAWWLILVSWLDWMEHEIPDVLTVPLLFAGLVWSPVDPDIQSRVLGAALAGLAVLGAFRITASVKGGDTMSLGDVALAGALGGWLGLCGIPPFLLGTCAVYVAYALPLRRKGRVWVPMGPAICAGFALIALMGLRIG